MTLGSSTDEQTAIPRKTQNVIKMDWEYFSLFIVFWVILSIFPHDEDNEERR